MIGLGFGVFFAGYTLLAYGWSQVRSSNATLVQLVWPGSYKNIAPPDPPAGPAPGTAQSGTTQGGRPASSLATGTNVSASGSNALIGPNMPST